MSFIGIIDKSRNEKYINQILNKELKGKTVIFLNEHNIENFKNIKFETIMIMSNVTKIFSEKEVLKGIISKAKYLIINADEEISLDLLEDISLNVITYGFNSKSTITTSSVKEDNILLCIQRNIQNQDKSELEQQEISIQKLSNKLSSNEIMGIATMLLIYGIQDIKV